MSSQRFIPGTERMIPQTTQPEIEPEGALQPEGRGVLEGVTQGHVGPALFLGREDDQGLPSVFSPQGIPHAELAFIAEILRDRARRGMREERPSFEQIGGQTDATTGNLVLKLHTVPAGWESHIVYAQVDAPDSATITPAAPLANAAIFSFISISPGGGDNPGSASAMRRGGVAFAPNAAAGPVIPGVWTFETTNSPIAFGGESVYYVLVGGSIAGARSLALQVSIRMNHYGPV